MQLTHRLTFSAGSESHSKEHSSALTNRLFPWPLQRPGSNMHHSTLLFSLYHFFFLLLCRLCKTAMAKQTGKSMILPLKNYTRIDIYHSFKLKGSEFVVWCWCLLLPGLYYYRRLSDQSFKACCFPFLFVPGITYNLVLPYHQPHYAQSFFFRICRSFAKWADLLYTHISKCTITGQTEELWQYFYTGMRVFAFWTQNIVRNSKFQTFPF